jgi:lipocalin
MRKAKVENPRYPHYIKIVRRMLPDRYSEQEYDEQIVYEGKGRSYTDTTTTGDAKVQSNKRKASIPVRFDEWKKVIPMSGDILYVIKGSIAEEWEVKDFEPDNNRSVVYGEFNRNANTEGA